MRKRRKGRSHEYVLIDLDTQEDFFTEDELCRVANAKALIPLLRNIIAWAKRNQVPMISSVDSHRPDEMSTCGLPPHCVDGSAGQRKLPFTLLDNRVSVEGDNTLSLPLDLFKRHQQVIFRKRTADLLANPKADRFLTQLAAREYVVFGLGLERSIKALALGLMARDRRVTVICNGCGYWNASEAEFSLRQLAAKGANVITAEQLLGRKIERHVRYSKLAKEACQVYPAGRSGIYPAVPTNGHSKRNGRSARSGS
ncbi:MAG: cysteine hydrolase [bacterium]|nr:cysteine hydrolase [bacterium]